MVETVTTSTYSIDNLLDDDDDFKLEAGESVESDAEVFFYNPDNLTDLATELATDLGVSGGTGVQAEMEKFITLRVANLPAEATVNDFLISVLEQLTSIAGDDNKIQADELKATNKMTETDDTKTNSSVTLAQSNTLAYGLLSNRGNDAVTSDIVQLFTAVEQTDAEGNVMKGADGEPVMAIAISAEDAQVVVDFFKNYGMMDTDASTMSEAEVAKLHEALIELKEELDGLSPTELANFDLNGFLNNFKDSDSGEKDMEDRLKKLGDSQKKAAEEAKSIMNDIATNQASAANANLIKGQTAFVSPF